MDLTQILMATAVLLPIAAAPVPYLLKRRNEILSDGFVSLICLAVLAAAVGIVLLPQDAVRLPRLFGMGLGFSSGGIKTVFTLLCAFLFFMSSLANRAYFRGEPRTWRYRAFLLLTLGGILGVFLAEDLFTLYIFFETMSLASWVWVAHNETAQAQKAADTYLAMAMIGGLTMLYGLFLLHHRFGTLVLEELKTLSAAAPKGLLLPGICLLVGFGIKAGMFPFHVWLPKAHPVAPAPSSALLSGILTKSGIFGILLTSTCLLWQNEAFALTVLLLGTVTMFLGALIALFSMDLKRTLACSSLSQIGFILVGAGILTLGQDVDLAAGGIMAHAINHALTKLVLFLCAGVLYKQTHTLDLNGLKGAGRKSPVLLVCFLIGGISLAGVPGMGGYVSKTLLHEAIVHQMHLGVLPEILSGVEILFLISGGLTFAYMSKLFVRIFLEKPEAGTPAVRPDRATAFAIVPAAAALVLMGLLPGRTYEAAAAFCAPSLGCEAIQVAYFTPENLKGAAISLTIGILVYWILVRHLLTDRKTGMYHGSTTVLDLEDDVYRPGLKGLSFAGALAARTAYCLTDFAVAAADWLLHLGSHQRIQPGRDHHFSHYSKGYIKMGPILQTLQFELMLFGLGVFVILVYLLIQL